MPGIKATAVAAILVIGTSAVGGQLAWGSSPSQAPRPYLATSFGTFPLSPFVAFSTTCSMLATASGGFVRCIHGDMAARLPPRLDQRIKADFRGIAVLTVPENTDSILIGYGRQPPIEYSTRPTVSWPLPGSGTYHVTITLKSHDEFTTSETTYYVPLWVPRGS